MKKIKNLFSVIQKQKLKIFKKIIFSFFIGIFFIGSISLISSFFLSTQKTYAKTNDSETQSSSTESSSTSTDSSIKKTYEEYQKDGMTASVKQKISEFAALLISVFTPLIAIIVKLIESLMGDDFIMGTNGTSGTPIAQVLYELWLVFRDVMNYIFILILLFFAFMNVISPFADSENYALKTILPKMILSIVVINMTWFGARVVFDIVDVSARVVFGLPQAIIEGTPYKDALDPKDPICDISPSKNGNKNLITMKGLCYPAYVNLDSQEGKCETKKNGDKKYYTKQCFSALLNTQAEGCEQLGDELYYSKECFPYSQIEKNKNDVEQLIKNLEKKKEAYHCGTSTDEKSITKCKELEYKITEIQKVIQRDSFKKAVDYGPITVYWEDFNYDRFNEQTIAPLFAFSIMQIQNLPRIAQTNLQEVTSEGTGWSTLVINVLISLIIMIILLVLFALMAINLFFRVLVLWINIIFSPFMGLLMFKDELKIGDPSGDYLGLAAFIKHAFAPVIMGIPLVVGFIMITVGKYYQIVKSGGTIGIDTPMIDNVSNLHQLFYYILAIVVLWLGGTKAVEATSSEFIRENMLNPITSGVESAAKFIASGPMYINFIPVAGQGSDGKQNMANLTQLSGFMDSLRSERERRSQKEAEQMGLGSGNIINNYITSNKTFAMGRSERGNKFKDAMTSLQKALESGSNKALSDWKDKNKEYVGVLDASRVEGMMKAISSVTGKSITESSIRNAKNALQVSVDSKNTKENETPKISLKIKGTNQSKSQKIEGTLEFVNAIKKENIEKDFDLLLKNITVGKALEELKNPDISQSEKKEIIENWILELKKIKKDNPEKEIEKSKAEELLDKLIEENNKKFEKEKKDNENK